MVATAIQFNTARVAPEKSIHPESACRTFISGAITGDSKMKKIPLGRGKFALIDDDDYDRVSMHTWHMKSRLHLNYASSTKYLGGGRKKAKYRMLQLHRFIMNPSKGMDVDHIDGNGLNNQKSNLRICTHQQNCMNTRKSRNTTSRYKGVSWDKESGKWKASIRFNNSLKNLGRYRTQKEAAKAYDKKAKELFGEYGNLNFKE